MHGQRGEPHAVPPPAGLEAIESHFNWVVNGGIGSEKKQLRAAPPLHELPELLLVLLVRRAVVEDENAVGLGVAFHVALQMGANRELHRRKKRVAVVAALLPVERKEALVAVERLN